MLILLWVQNELSHDKFHKNHNDIYQVIANRSFNNQVFTDRSMVLPLTSELENNLPQIKHVVVTTSGQDHILAQGENKIKKKGLLVGDHVFDVHMGFCKSKCRHCANRASFNCINGICC